MLEYYREVESCWEGLEMDLNQMFIKCYVNDSQYDKDDGELWSWNLSTVYI